MQSDNLATYSKPNQNPILSKKVKDLERKEVGFIVAYVCAVTGITRATSDFAAKVTVDFIINKYQNFGILEFKTAFDMWVQGRLPKRDNESHYNTISAAFIGSVMQKYQTFRIKEIRDLEQKHTEKPKEKTTYSPEIYENAYNFAVGYIHKNQKLPPGGHWIFIYNHFEAKGMGWCGYDDDTRRHAKKEFLEIVTRQLNSESKHKNIQGVNAKTALGNKNLIAAECKIRYVKRELTKLIKNKS